jgi:radical SAM protein with 4Fe4S-binding SPASM domain
MAQSLIDKIIDELVEIDFRGYVRPYLMNECFLDPRMPAIMQTICKRLPEALCVVNTNGDLLSVELARELGRMGVKIRVSAYNQEVLRRFEAAGVPKMHITNMTRLHEGLPETFNNRAGAVLGIGQDTIPQEGCHFPFAQMYIRHDGRVVLCCNDYYNRVIMGDVNEESLMAIFNNAKYGRYRRALSKGERTLTLCKDCNQRERLTWRTPSTS